MMWVLPGVALREGKYDDDVTLPVLKLIRAALLKVCGCCDCARYGCHYGNEGLQGSD